MKGISKPKKGFLSFINNFYTIKNYNLAYITFLKRGKIEALWFFSQIYFGRHYMEYRLFDFVAVDYLRNMGL